MDIQSVINIIEYLNISIVINKLRRKPTVLEYSTIHCKHKSGKLQKQVPIFAGKKAFMLEYRNQILIFHGSIIRN